MNTREILWGDTLPINDFLSLAGIVQEWLSAATDTKDKTLEQLRQNRYPMFVLEHERLIGHAALSKLGASSWELSSVIVHDSLRGHGYGSFLVQQLVGFFKEYDDPSFETLTVVCPDHLASFYKTFGFVHCEQGELPDDSTSARFKQATDDGRQFLLLSSV